MQSKRKFYKQTIVIEVLSEDKPIKWESLEDIQYEITEGHSSGTVDEKKCQQVTSKTMAKLLLKQHSDPSFFNLTNTGEEMKED